MSRDSPFIEVLTYHVPAGFKTTFTFCFIVDSGYAIAHENRAELSKKKIFYNFLILKKNFLLTFFYKTFEYAEYLKNN